jgi:threonine dehydrogenase-like Zn-dependent dehydrogenase
MTGSSICRSVAVIGLGPIGMMAVELAYAMGPTVVFAVDPVPSRRELATALGAVALAPNDIEAHIREATHGPMVDSVIEAVGKTATVDLAMAIVGAGRNVNILTGMSTGGTDMGAIPGAPARAPNPANTCTAPKNVWFSPQASIG